MQQRRRRCVRGTVPRVLLPLVLRAHADETCPTSVNGKNRAHFSPHRAVNLNRTGSSEYLGPRNLTRPAWTVRAPGGRVFHQTPVIDHEGNVYIGSDAGQVLSVDRYGQLRWSVQASPSSSQCPSLYGDVLYTAGADGIVRALDTATGHERWQTKVSETLPPDTYAVTAFNGTVVVPANRVPGVGFGSPEVVALDASGVVRWRYYLGLLHKTMTINLLPVIIDGSVIFNDVFGGVYRLSVEDGKEQWHVRGASTTAFTLGGVGLGPNGVLYCGSSTEPTASGRGLVRALGLNGTVLWERRLPPEIHAAPAVGRLEPGGPLALVLGAGSPTGDPETRWEEVMRRLGLTRSPRFEGTVYALHAETGDTLWEFSPSAWTQKACAGSTRELPCNPDLWSLPVISGDGTVYINWSAGGVTYALRDVDGNGVLDPNDPHEVASYDSGSGATGPPVVAPGMLVVATCKQMLAFMD